VENIKFRNLFLTGISAVLFLTASAGTYKLFSKSINSIRKGEKENLLVYLGLKEAPAKSLSEEEENNSYQTANEISVNTAYEGVLSNSYDKGEEDWYHFSLDKGGEISFTVKTKKQKKGEETYWNATLRNGDSPEEKMINDHIFGKTEQYSSSAYYMPAGDYYFEIESSSNYSDDPYIFTINYDSRLQEYCGSYVAGQGITNCNLLLTWDVNNNIIGTFNFFANPINPDVPSGRYTVTGNVLNDNGNDEYKVRFSGDTWVNQPDGYGMINFDAIVNKKTGQIIEINNGYGTYYQMNLLREDLFKTEKSVYENKIVEFGGHKYCYFSNSLSWNNAEKFCRDIGGHLVSINSAEEQDFVQSVADASNSENLWIGGYYDEEKWKWTDGSDFSYSNWDEAKPDNYFGNEFYTKFPCRDQEFESWAAHRGKWDDVSLIADGLEGDVPVSSFGFICEWSD